MNLKYYLLFFIILLLPASTAQTVNSAEDTKCATPYPIVASANTGAGYINVCLFYPKVVIPGSTFSVSIVLTAPTTVSPAFTTAAAAFTPNSGCTEGTPATVMPTTNGVVGTMWEAATFLTITTEMCDFSASASLSVAVTPIQIYTVTIHAQVNTENIRVDNYNYLCAATGGVPNSFSTTGTTCNIPRITTYSFLCDATGTTPSVYVDTSTNCNDLVLSGIFTLSGTINVVNSGGQSITISSWPDLIASVTNSGTINIQNTAGQTFALSGTLNTQLSGTITVTNQGGQTLTISSWPQLQAVLSGQINVLDYGCIATGAAPASFNTATTLCNRPVVGVLNYNCDETSTTLNGFGGGSNTCNSLSSATALSGTINVVNSGGQSIIITSWPTLTASVTNSGTLNIQNTAGQTFAISGNVNTAISGSLTLTDDANGWSIDIDSWPELQAIINGEIDIHQDQACGLDTACHIECDNGTCMSDVNIGNNTNNVNSTTELKLDFVKPILILLAIAFFVVVAEARSDALYWFTATILSIYLLINRGNSVIPVGIYVGWIFITLYQGIALLMNKKALNLSGNE